MLWFSHTNSLKLETSHKSGLVGFCYNNAA